MYSHFQPVNLSFRFLTRIPTNTILILHKIENGFYQLNIEEKQDKIKSKSIKKSPPETTLTEQPFFTTSCGGIAASSGGEGKGGGGSEFGGAGGATP